MLWSRKHVRVSPTNKMCCLVVGIAIQHYLLPNDTSSIVQSVPLVIVLAFCNHTNPLVHVEITVR